MDMIITEIIVNLAITYIITRYLLFTTRFIKKKFTQTPTGLVFVRKKLKKISNNEIEFSGHLVNYGKDISENMVKDDISVCLPPGAEWLDFNITPNSKAIKPKEEGSNQKKRIIKLDLFKKKEFLYLQSRIKLDKDIDEGKFLKRKKWEKKF